jgi:hypothetical protein
LHFVTSAAAARATTAAPRIDLDGTHQQTDGDKRDRQY